ncbi:MAG: protein kinase [Coprobacillus sp.]|nr:protein kinase [Coprobacillus sp.]
MELKPGQMINDLYRITGDVGRGGMAEIYEAYDVLHKRPVALKFIREDTMKNPKNVRRFENEAAIASSLNHPNIVAVYDHGEVDGRAYIVNELIKGSTLKEILDIRAPLSIPECLDIMIQVTEALSYAHQKGVVHRDIKPHNIFYETDGTVKIGDFGIATAEGVTAENLPTNDIQGSVHYLAPEITQGKGASVQSDIYSLGCTLYEMITGHTPFNGSSPVKIALAHVEQPFPSPRVYMPSCPLSLETIILKACQKKPKDRYKSAMELHDDLIKVKENKDIDEKKGFMSRIFGFK